MRLRTRYLVVVVVTLLLTSATLIAEMLAQAPLQPKSTAGALSSDLPRPIHSSVHLERRAQRHTASTALLVVASFWAGTTWSASKVGLPLTARTTQSSTPAAVQPEQPAPRPLFDDGAPPVVNRVLRFTPGVDWHPAS
jgi:hypothetical protein